MFHLSARPVIDTEKHGRAKRVTEGSDLSLLGSLCQQETDRFAGG